MSYKNDPEYIAYRAACEADWANEEAARLARKEEVRKLEMEFQAKQAAKGFRFATESDQEFCDNRKSGFDFDEYESRGLKRGDFV